MKACENTWSNQRSKRRKKDETNSNYNNFCGADSDKNLITFTVQTKLTNKNDLFLEFITEDLVMKDSLNQIILYIRNQVFKS